jgi:DNA modification methylase
MPSLQFKGKSFVVNHHLAVPYHELTPVRTKGTSKTASLHDNLIVEGDNLKALKALLPAYHGKVKCIYIDPPYNTGNEGWAYNDNVSSPMLQEWLGKTVDREDLTRHDKWCCMMLPRLKLLREFLTDDGAIFVSIDDNEVHRLRCLMDEVFGEDCFLGEICWKTRNTDNRIKTNLSRDQEYILVYGRQPETSLRGRVIDRSGFQNPDKDPRGAYVTDPLTGKATAADRPNLHFDILNEATGDVFSPDSSRGWITDRAGIERLKKEGKIWWPPNPRSGKPRKKRFLSETSERMPFSSFWSDLKGQSGADEVDQIFGKRVFAFPKALEVIHQILDFATDKDSIVMDSFAGSATTAHAVLGLNNEDGGKRRFVLVECEDYADSITAERVRRVANGLPAAKDEALKAGLGGTFSYFKLGRALQLKAILEGKSLPDFESLARYVFFTATGEEFNANQIDRATGFIGASRHHDVFLLYTEDAGQLKQLALTLDAARALPSVSGKPKLVFAPTKYLDDSFLDRLRITFCQLPFQIYKALEA